MSAGRGIRVLDAIADIATLLVLAIAGVGQFLPWVHTIPARQMGSGSVPPPTAESAVEFQMWHATHSGTALAAAADKVALHIKIGQAQPEVSFEGWTQVSDMYLPRAKSSDQGGGTIRFPLPPGDYYLLVYVPSSPQRAMLLPTGPGQPRTLDLGPLASLIVAGSWMPDGRHILVSANKPGRTPGLWLLDAAGGPPKPVSPEGISFGTRARSSPETSSWSGSGATTTSATAGWSTPTSAGCG